MVSIFYLNASHFYLNEDKFAVLAVRYGSEKPKKFSNTCKGFQFRCILTFIITNIRKKNGSVSSIKLLIHRFPLVVTCVEHFTFCFLQ